MTGQPPGPRGEIWDPFGTLRDALWIGGGQWAGKSTAAQLRDLPRAATFNQQVSDPARGQRNRLARDRIVAEDAASSARRLGIRVIEVDGTHDANAIAGIVADHFRPYLPPPAADT